MSVQSKMCLLLDLIAHLILDCWRSFFRAIFSLSPKGCVSRERKVLM